MLIAEFLNYTLTDFRKDQEIDIHLNFSEPLYVSFEGENNNRESLDRLLVSLKDAHIFIDPFFNATVKPDLLQKEAVPVPRQESNHKTGLAKLAE